MQTVAGLFKTYEDADQALSRLENAGYEREVIGVLARQDVLETREDAGEAVAAGDDGEVAEGAAGGAIIGGIAGFIAGLGALAIPGLGLVITAGTIAATLGSTALGAGVGAAAGGVIGALVDMGLPEEEAEHYAEGVKRGGILVAINATEDRVDEVADILSDSGAVDVASARAQWEESGWSGFDPTMDPGEQYPRLV